MNKNIERIKEEVFSMSLGDVISFILKDDERDYECYMDLINHLQECVEIMLPYYIEGVFGNDK